MALGIVMIVVSSISDNIMVVAVVVVVSGKIYY